MANINNLLYSMNCRVIGLIIVLLLSVEKISGVFRIAAARTGMCRYCTGN